MTTFFVRPEEARDVIAIAEVTGAAFRASRHGDSGEAGIIARLRSDGDLELSLVAESASRVIGHIAFSPVTVDDTFDEWYGLGPVSVLPDRQGHGIGAALIERGIATLRDRGAHGIVLLGAPAYYARFGFAQDPRLTFPGAPAEYFQYLLFAGEVPAGEVRYPAAFG